MNRPFQVVIVVVILAISLALLPYLGLPYRPLSVAALRLNLYETPTPTPTPTPTVLPPSLEIDIYTDKNVYDEHDLMIVGLDMANRGPAQPVMLQLLLWTPWRLIPVFRTPLTLPANFEYSNSSLFTWRLPKLPNTSYAWVAILVPVQGDAAIDVAWWRFLHLAEGKDTGSVGEVLRALEQLQIDFGQGKITPEDQ